MVDAENEGEIYGKEDSIKLLEITGAPRITPEKSSSPSLSQKEALKRRLLIHHVYMISSASSKQFIFLNC